MHPELIKAQIRMKGGSLSSIAREADVSPNAVRLVVHGQGKSKKIAKRIADLIDTPLEELWPGVYPIRAKRATQ